VYIIATGCIVVTVISATYRSGCPSSQVAICTTHTYSYKVGKKTTNSIYFVFNVKTTIVYFLCMTIQGNGECRTMSLERKLYM
jgi:hypothetical protein